jgi:hypothetical protein
VKVLLVKERPGEERVMEGARIEEPQMQKRLVEEPTLR